MPRLTTARRPSDHPSTEPMPRPRRPDFLRDTIAHTRPASWPIVLSHYLGGTFIVLAHDRQPTGFALAFAILGGFSWTVLLHGGGLALNTAFDSLIEAFARRGSDHDGGGPGVGAGGGAGGGAVIDLGYLVDPPPVPRGLALTALGFLGAGLVVAFLSVFVVGGPGYLIAYLVAAIFSVLYSLPPLRLKSVAGADVGLSMTGYGALTFAAGALAAGVGSTLEAGDPGFSRGLGPAIAWLSVGFGFLFGAFYPMSQIHVMGLDAARGDRTLTVMLGARWSLAASIALVALCGVAQGIAAYQLSLRPWAWIALLASTGAWVVFTIDWLRRSEGYPSRAGMYRALRLWALSDIVVILTFSFGTRVLPIG